MSSLLPSTLWSKLPLLLTSQSPSSLPWAPCCLPPQPHSHLHALPQPALSSHSSQRSLCMQIITLPPTTPILLRLKPRLLTLVSTLMMATLSPSPSLLKLKLQWPLSAQLNAAAAPFHMQFLLLLPPGVHMTGSSLSTGFRSKDTSSEQPCPGNSKLYLVTFPLFSPIRCFSDSTSH